MDPRRLRPLSPTRRSGHPGRNSTGLLDLHPSYDAYGGPRSSRELVSGPRSSADRVGAPRTSHLSSRAETLPVRNNPNDYDVAPRMRAGTETLRRPVSIVPTSARDYRPAVQSAVDRTPRYHLHGRPREDESFYVQPAVSSRRDHNRTFSNEGPDYGRYLAVDRDRARERPERGEYRGLAEGSGRYSNTPQIRPPRDKDDHDFGYEYTDFKEQAYRDTAPRPRPRRESDAGARERPLSITGLEDYAKRSPQPPREAGPPVSTRGFSKIDRDGSVRREYRYPRDSDRAKGAYEDDEGLLSPKAGNAPVSLHQDGYSSNTEDRGHERRHRSRRAESIDRSAEAVPSSRYPKAEEGGHRDSEKSRRHERHRSESRDDHHHHDHHSKYHVDGTRDYYTSEGGRRDRGDDLDREARRKSREESEKEYSRRNRGEESERERRRHDRTDESKREKDKDRHERHVGEGVALGAAGAAAAAAGAYAESSKHRREKRSTDPRDAENTGTRDIPGVSVPPQENSDEERRERRRRRRKEREEREQQEALSRSKNEPAGGAKDFTGAFDANGRPLERAAPEEKRRESQHRRKDSQRHRGSSSSSSEEDTRPRRVRIAEPGKPVPEAKPKGILRTPKAKFPEDPAPIREGVAPLKDAGKKGIPPNARWTKIDRRLVNPDALEMGNERFEERADYVIVLRVLSKEEIEAYAQKTMEIREERQIEAQRSHMLALEDKERGYDEEREAPKRLDSRPHEEGGHDLPVRPREHNEARGGASSQQQQQQAAVGGGSMPLPNLAASQESFDSSRPDYYPSTSYVRVAPASMSSTTGSLNSLNATQQGGGGKFSSQPVPSLSSTTASLSSVNPPSSTQSSQQQQQQQQQQYPVQGQGQGQGQGQHESFSQSSYAYPPSQGGTTASSQESYHHDRAGQQKGGGAYPQGGGGAGAGGGYAPPPQGYYNSNGASNNGSGGGGSSQSQSQPQPHQHPLPPSQSSSSSSQAPAVGGGGSWQG